MKTKTFVSFLRQCIVFLFTDVKKLERQWSETDINEFQILFKRSTYTKGGFKYQPAQEEIQEDSSSIGYQAIIKKKRTKRQRDKPTIGPTMTMIVNHNKMFLGWLVVVIFFFILGFTARQDCFTHFEPGQS